MATDLFAKFDGFDGESTDDKHKGWVELAGVELGVSQPITGASATGGRTGGRADFEPVSLSAPINAATPDLLIHCANGKHIPKVEIECCLASEEKHPFFKVELKNVVVQSNHIVANGATDATKPMQRMLLSFGQVKYEYTPIGSDGKTGSATDRTWSIEEGKQV